MPPTDKYKGDIPTMELPVHTPRFRPGAYKAVSETAVLVGRIDSSVFMQAAPGTLPQSCRQLVPEIQRSIGTASEAENRVGHRIRDMLGRPIRTNSISESLISAVEYVCSVKFTDSESGSPSRLRLVMLHCGHPVCRRFLFTNASISSLYEFEGLIKCVTSMRSIRLDKPPGSLRFLYMTHRDAEKAVFDFCKAHPATDSAVAAAENIRDSAPLIDLPAPSPNQRMDEFGNRVAHPIQGQQSKFYGYLSACRPSNNTLGLGIEHFRHARVVRDPDLLRRFRNAKCKVGGVDISLLSRLAEVVVGDKRYLVSKGIHPAKIADGSMASTGEVSIIDASRYACFIRPGVSSQAASEENCVYIVLMAQAEGSSFSITPSRVSIMETPLPQPSEAEELVLAAQNSVRNLAREFGASWMPEGEFSENAGDIAILAVRGGEHYAITNMNFTKACERLEAHLSTLSTRVFLTPVISHIRSQEASLPNGGKMRINIVPCGKSEKQVDEDTPVPTPLVLPAAASHGAEGEKRARPAAGGPREGVPSDKDELASLLRGAILYAPISTFLDPAEERLFEIRRKFLSSFSRKVISASLRIDGGRATACTRIMISGNFWFQLLRLNCALEDLPPGLLNVRNAIIFSKAGVGYILVANSSITPEVKQLLLECSTLLYQSNNPPI